MTDTTQTVSLDTCNERHKGNRRLIHGLYLAVIAMSGLVGFAAYAGTAARQEVDVQGAAQQEVNKRVLDSLQEIKDELRLLRNYHRPDK